MQERAHIVHTVQKLIIVLILLFAVSTVSAQWSRLYSFNSQIFSIHFLSSVGKTNIGYVGTANGSIWRTTSNGKSWQKSITPVTLNGPITGFAFKDAATGWASARQTSLAAGVFKTVDSGKTWTPTTLNGEQTSIYYNPTTQLVLTTSWSGQNARSTNDGMTWVPLGIIGNQNGISFINGMNGVMTTYTGTYSVTNDGGYTWTSVSFGEEAWQPLAVPGRGYYVAAESQRQIIRSTDGGYTWNTIHQFPTGVEINGDLHGDSSMLYVQTRDRFLYSTNGGTIWIDHCGPGNAYDTRFFVSGDTVYAGTVDGDIWSNEYGTKRLKNLLDFSSHKLIFRSPGCFSIDSFLKFINLSDCYQVKLTDIGVLGSPAFSIVKPTLPLTLGVHDSIRVRYSPDDFLPDSAKLIINYSVNGILYEIQIELNGNGTPGDNIQLTKELNLLLASDCKTIDTAITITNGPCDSIQVQSLFISAPSIFTLSNASSFPQTVVPGGTVRIMVETVGTIPGEYIATLIIRLRSNGIERDTSVTLRLKVLSGKEPQAQLSQSRLRFDSVTICQARFDTLWFKNTICKPMKLTAISLVSNNPNYYIHYRPALPRTLAPDEDDHIIIRYTPTSQQTDLEQLLLSFEFDSSNGSDTTIYIEGSGKALSDVSLQEYTLSFEPLLLCEQTELTTYIRNFSCDSATILEISGLTDSSFRVLSPAVPRTIAPDDSLLIRIAEIPLSDGAKFDSIKIKIRTRNGAEQTITLKLVGTVKSKVRSLSFPTGIFVDSIAPCATLDTSFTIYNTGVCDTLILTSSDVTGPSWLSLIGGPLTPAFIPPGDSATFTVRFSPGSGSSATGNIRLKGIGLDTTITIVVSSKEGGAPFILSFEDSIFYAFLCKKSSRTFTIANNGCDPLKIDTLLLGVNQQFTVSPGLILPITIAPNEDTAITIHFDPSVIGDSTSSLTIVSTSNGIRRIVLLRGSLIGTKGTMRIDVASDDNSPTIIKPAGDVFTTRVLVKDIVEPIRDLRSIQFDIRFNTNVLSVTNPAVSPGWEFNRREDSAGLLRLFLSRKTSAQINADDELCKISFRVTIGDSSYSPITVTNIILNEDDQIYHDCVLEPLALTGSILYVDDTCGDAFIRGYINHDASIFDNMRIVPNPSENDNRITTVFTLNLTGDVSLSIYDLNGIVVASATYPKLPTGKHSIVIPTLSLPNGIYLAGLESNGHRQMMKFIVKK